MIFSLPKYFQKIEVYILKSRAEILVIFGWHFGRNDDQAFKEPDFGNANYAILIG